MITKWLRPGVLAALVLTLALAGGALVRAQMTPTAVFTTAQGNQVTLNLEVADTPEKHSRGLMFRTELPEDNGMLFIFPDTVLVGFWMKDTPLPLSIAFISAEGKIVDILDMEPLTTNIYLPSSPYKYAIEVNQGYYARKGIAIGDTVQFNLGQP